MRRISLFSIVAACTLTRAARADLPNTAPIYGSDDLQAIGAALEHSVSAPGQNDSSRDEAERRLREDGEHQAIALGSTATSIGATMFIGGIFVASTSSWDSSNCVACFPSLMLLGGGFQLTLAGILFLADHDGNHHGRGHRHRVDALVSAMSHPSIESANAARRHRLTLAWTLLTTGVALAGGSVALFAMGHQSGFDDAAREGIAAASAFTGGWLVTIASGELASKWTDEMAIAPTRGGAMITYERRW